MFSLCLSHCIYLRDFLLILLLIKQITQLGIIQLYLVSGSLCHAGFIKIGRGWEPAGRASDPARRVSEPAGRVKEIKRKGSNPGMWWDQKMETDFFGS